MAALRALRAALVSMGFQRVWAAMGTSDGCDEWSPTGDGVAPRAVPSSSGGEGRTFRLLDSGAWDLLDVEELAGGPALMAAGVAQSSIKAAVAGVIAWVAAAAVGMTFLLPPGRADAYHYRTDGGHFDHAQKDLIRLWPSFTSIYHPDTYKAFVGGAWDWSILSDVKITIDDDPYANWRSPMYILGRHYDDPSWSWLGRTYLASPGDRSHWIREPGATIDLNMGRIRQDAADAEGLARTTVNHEIGHALGLAHTGDVGCDGTQWNQGIMQDTSDIYYECKFFQPQQDDITGVNRLYRASSK